ncbi:hypothetical protein [Verminephrobacter eiseniae]|uniref:hypothetical protein n=1 Tax=Verminephrobacter eiseniae TaxID=364317 RepID=UPI002244D071|nr:hypothetical protein [Verminephrobacter eiseniae]
MDSADGSQRTEARALPAKTAQCGEKGHAVFPFRQGGEMFPRTAQGRGSVKCKRYMQAFAFWRLCAWRISP